MLVTDGGDKVRQDSFPKRHLFGPEEIEAVLAAVRKVEEAYLR